MKHWHIKWYLALIFVLAVSFIYAIAPQQKKTHDYVFTITVEGKSDDEGERILDELEKYCEKNKIKFDLYQKKDYDKRMEVKFR